MGLPGRQSPNRGQPCGRFAWALTAAVFLGACGEEDDGVFDERALRGSVVDDLTDRGISGVTVVFVSDTLDETRTVTDGDGRFEMAVELSAMVRLGHLYAEANGYQRSPRLSIFFDGTERSAELRLRALVSDDE